MITIQFPTGVLVKVPRAKSLDALKNGAVELKTSERGKVLVYVPPMSGCIFHLPKFIGPFPATKTGAAR